MAKAPAPSSDHMRMLATTGNDITVPIYGTVLRPQDATIAARGGSQGIRLYDEVRRDGHALAVLGKRSRKVLARDWEVKPASDAAIDVTAAELVEQQLRGLPFDRVCASLLEATLMGYAVAEIEWARKGSQIVPRQVIGHAAARFVFDRDWRPRLLTPAQPFDGEALPDRKFIVHRYEPDGSDPYGRGLGRVLFWHVLFKREGVGFWAHFLEKFASPTPVAKYPYGTPPSEQDRLLQHLLQLVQQGALAVPIGTEISFLEGSQGGAVSYDDWCRYWDEQTSITVLGETLSTTLDGVGARAAVDGHMEVSDGIADADADMLSATLNDSLVRWITEFNVPGARPPTVWRPRPKNEQAIEEHRRRRAERVAKEIENLFRLAGRGYRPAEGIEAALSAIIDAPVVDDQALTSRFRGTAMGSTALSPAADFALHDHGIGHLVDLAETAAAPELRRLVERIRDELAAIAATGGELGDVPSRLLPLAGSFDVDPLGRILGPALALAELNGRADVDDETR